MQANREIICITTEFNEFSESISGLSRLIQPPIHLLAARTAHTVSSISTIAEIGKFSARVTFEYSLLARISGLDRRYRRHYSLLVTPAVSRIIITLREWQHVRLTFC
jgi:hypothetical protein